MLTPHDCNPEYHAFLAQPAHKQHTKHVPEGKACPVVPRCLQQSGNRGRQASTSAAPDQAHGAVTNGALHAYSGEDPAWLGLAQVFYAMLPGSQQPTFRVAIGEQDTRAWLAWEVRLLACCCPPAQQMPATRYAKAAEQRLPPICA